LSHCIKCLDLNVRTRIKNGINVIKKYIKKGDLLYLDGVQTIHQKHMDILSELMNHPTLGMGITELTDTKEGLLKKQLLNNEIKPPYKKPRQISKEKIE